MWGDPDFKRCMVKSPDTGKTEVSLRADSVLNEKAKEKQATLLRTLEEVKKMGKGPKKDH